MNTLNQQQAIQNLIIKTSSKEKNITEDQLELLKELYMDDKRNLNDIKSEIYSYYSSIDMVNTKTSMKKIKNKNIYNLNIQNSTKGIYLGETQIDLITITEIKSIDQLLDFIENCAQIKYSKTELRQICKMELTLAKRKVFDDYRNTLTGKIDIEKDSTINLRKKFELLGLEEEIIDKTIELYKKGKAQQAIDYITLKTSSNYKYILDQAFKLHNLDYDNVKCSTYEEIASLSKKISSFDIITIVSGRYQLVMNNGEFNSYHIKRDLDFCLEHNIQVRYHSLLTKEMLNTFENIKKTEIIKKLRNYISSSINFINSYNHNNKLFDGRQVITEVVVFDELINLKKDKTSSTAYYNIWEQLGLTMEDLIYIFTSAIKNKPSGVKYIYNESFVETKEKRQIQLSLAKQIKLKVPELIDIFGTKMHITTRFTTPTIENTFLDLKKFNEETDIELAITEFNLHIPEITIDKLINLGKTEKEIEEYAMYAKIEQLNRINLLIETVKIKFIGITYWSLTNSMDYNKRKSLKQTLYGGLFGNTLLPKAINEIVNLPDFTRPSDIKDISNDYNILNNILEKAPLIIPTISGEILSQ